MSKLKIAIQKSGRLSEKSLELLKDCGIKISTSNRKLRTESSNFPIEVLFLRDDDIPQYVEQGVADIGILGENEVWEKDKNINNVRKLGFAGCKLCLAIPKDEIYTDLSYFENKKIATSYPKILGNFFQEKGINVKIEEIGGSVEIAPSIGLANAIFDIVSTGSTLLTNGLKQVETVVESEAILVANKNLDTEKQAILDRLMFRIEAVKQSSENKYILLNAPNDKLEEIIGLLPGMKSPTVLPLAQDGWSSIHTVVKEDTFWDIIEQLKELGAEGILVLEIEKMIL
ncbi:ATP phosphoribosyltransferase [Chishuiella sp.]|uniref:ATP phosphoribosyltransferase n=1 Tax=Chishuiella sp. TaxID=1969467 RepID=UPI0028AA40C1|nr:ATP phosphoribosyltransferase [Chishuiella sp.]